MSDKNLATIRTIKSLEPINGADKIVLAKFNEVFWQSVVKKAQFNIGDKVIYIVIDTILPKDAPWSQFLKNNTQTDEPIRLKSAKLRSVLSQGLTLPLDVLPVGEYEIGQDVTDILKIEKYEKPISVQMAGQVKGNYPTFIKKTNEERLQNVPNVLRELIGKEIYIAQKIDGSSSTFYFNNGEFGVCSRNLDLKESESNVFWKMAIKYDIQNKLKELNRNISIQGETFGTGVNGNKLGKTDVDLVLFNAWDIDEQKYLGLKGLKELSEILNIPHVPIIYQGIYDEKWDINYFLNLADEQKYPNGSQAEGIVIRTVEESYSRELNGRMSFKVISNKFALKYGE